MYSNLVGFSCVAAGEEHDLFELGRKWLEALGSGSVEVDRAYERSGFFLDNRYACSHIPREEGDCIGKYGIGR